MSLGVGTREARSIAAILLSLRVPAEPAGNGNTSLRRHASFAGAGRRGGGLKVE